MQHSPTQQRFRAAVKQGWTNFVAAHRAHRAAHFTAPTPAIDPVTLTMLAVNRLGPATMRTATNGKALTVVVPDLRVAEIFRAALREMQKTRCTDRLVDIVVALETAAPAARGSA
jgi:hypothetical protein